MTKHDIKDISNNIPQPDPSWDYYIEWHKLIKAKAHLNKLIEFMSNVENATEETQDMLIGHLSTITNILENI